MRTIVVVQARRNSTRLPNKVLADIAGKPMIQHVIERASRIPGIAGVCLAIPSSDALLADYADGHYVVTGPEDDVLTRYVIAAEITNAQRIVRITADCPFLDPYIAGSVLALHDVGSDAFPYASNVHPRRTFPDGLDVEVFTAERLERADKLARGPEREHVTTVMRMPDSPCLTAAVDYGRLKWSVDTARELTFAQVVMDKVPLGCYRMADTLEAVRASGWWDDHPISEDWQRTQA